MARKMGVCMGVFVLALTAMAGTAGAAADVSIQGIYEGQFSSGPWKGDALIVQVVATGKGTFRAVFPMVTPRVFVAGQKGDDRTVAFAGDVDLSAKGGTFSVSARLADNVIEGVFDGKGRNSKFDARKVDKPSPTRGQEPPQGAVVLLDGTNLDSWQRHPLKWNLVEDGAMEVCGSNLITVPEFGDAFIHIEFRTPFMPDSAPGSQARGNSGVYIQGRYEVQVLDSFGVDPAWDLCGGIYKVAVPAADACLPPLEWQTYDIDFTAPTFDADGKKTANARLTVRHNGIVIHDNIELPECTGGSISGAEAPIGPIMLQDHGNQVRFRNCWVVPR